MRKSYLKKVATKSFVGRVLRRLLGEEKGTVMMEYIVVGLLIAAVAVIAVGIFGGAINDMFAAMSEIVVIQPQSSVQTINNARTRVTTDTQGLNTQHVQAIKRSDNAQDVNGTAATW